MCSVVEKVVRRGENRLCVVGRADDGVSVVGADEVWGQVANQLKEMVADGVWQSTFSQVKAIDLVNDIIVLSVPNSIVREKLEGTYRGLVEAAVAQACDTTLTVQIDLRPPTLFDSLSDDIGPTVDRPIEPSHVEALDVRDRLDGRPTATDEGPYRPAPSLDGAKRYTFEGFVIGPSNRFAHAAALSVGERPGESYNPLFIYGAAGLGKTHLLRAIEHYVNDVYPDLRVLYISTEQFLNEFVDAIKNSSNNEFKRRYRQIDVLLVDDIQFIAGKDGLQEEFFHTFNELYGSGRQIVLSSDRPPDAIPTLEDRLRSRFMMGLLTDIQPPDVETRMAILRKKADRDGYFIPNEVSEFIATNITSNIRELEGALTKVTAYANLNRQPMTRDLAEQTLRDFIADRQPRPITVGDDPRCHLGSVRLRPQRTDGPIPPSAARRGPPDRHVRDTRTHRPQLPADRPRIRRSRSHHGHARLREDHPPDDRALSDLREGRGPGTYRSLDGPCQRLTVCQRLTSTLSLGTTLSLALWGRPCGRHRGQGEDHRWTTRRSSPGLPCTRAQLGDDARPPRDNRRPPDQATTVVVHNPQHLLPLPSMNNTFV